ncbi:hypothetical protein E2C01_005108 [Portunus trituberculatus]|uniref:Uncharacterized protein n=1 Tax=Portunus trituberculatus TaxID=210409 RepID=A0A5B7CUN6_PORTR|nr:hypothetical protein [Portunus trituberculatus]
MPRRSVMTRRNFSVQSSPGCHGPAMRLAATHLVFWVHAECVHLEAGQGGAKVKSRAVEQHRDKGLILSNLKRKMNPYTFPSNDFCRSYTSSTCTPFTPMSSSSSVNRPVKEPGQKAVNSRL